MLSDKQRNEWGDYGSTRDRYSSRSEPVGVLENAETLDARTINGMENVLSCTCSSTISCSLGAILPVAVADRLPAAESESQQGM